MAPQSATRGDEHRIVAAQFHAFEGHDVGTFAAQLVHGQKFVEDAIVEHQQHRGVCRVVLYAEESLAGVVGLHVVHPRFGDDALVL